MFLQEMSSRRQIQVENIGSDTEILVRLSAMESLLSVPGESTEHLMVPRTVPAGHRLSSRALSCVKPLDASYSIFRTTLKIGCSTEGKTEAQMQAASLKSNGSRQVMNS